jgi:hypothetical protein
VASSLFALSEVLVNVKASPPQGVRTTRDGKSIDGFLFGLWSLHQIKKVSD